MSKKFDRRVKEYRDTYWTPGLCSPDTRPACLFSHPVRTVVSQEEVQPQWQRILHRHLVGVWSELLTRPRFLTKAVATGSKTSR